MAASSGIDVKTLQEIAEHSDIKLTMERYARKKQMAQGKNSIPPYRLCAMICAESPIFIKTTTYTWLQNEKSRSAPSETEGALQPCVPEKNPDILTD